MHSRIIGEPVESFIESVPNPLAIPLAFALGALSGAVNAPPAARRGLAAALVAATFFVPWLASPEPPIARAVCSGAAVLAVFRNLDLLRERQGWSAVRRASHVACLFDSRRLKRTNPAFDRASFLRFVAFGVLSLLSTWMLVRIGSPSDFPAFAARFICGALWAYSSIEVIVALILLVLRRAGWQPPKLHNDPVLSRTLAEFWGLRWNLVVHQLLHDHVFRPLARRSNISMAILGTFAGSALLHFWLVWSATGAMMALSIAAYFALQGLLVIAEQEAGVRHWRRSLQHVWAVSGIVLPLPLLLEPLLRVAFG